MSESLRIIAGSTPESLQQHAPLPLFSEQALAFLYDISENLLHNPDCRPYPNLAALGFWLRPASLRSMADDYYYVPPGHRQQAAGLVFHITPANVDNLFVYSWAISLLCGNNNIVRLSNHESGERQMLLALLGTLLREPRHRDIHDRSAIVSYGHDDQTTIALSSSAARRVLWGGNKTIAHLRALPVTPLCQDIVFPDRRSAALLSAKAVCQEESLDALLEAFYRDAYGFNQMACSSPRLVLWLNDGDIGSARERFWNGLDAMVTKKNPPLPPSVLMDKQVALQSMALTSELKIRALPDARLQVIELDFPDVKIWNEHPGGGLFLDSEIDDLAALGVWLPQDSQTLTYWGIAATDIKQITDRIVPVGQALLFSPVWDGMNLFERLSRLVRAE